ncbi:MAG: anti-sigma factor antagonist [Chrysiogenales bacterium]|nr:MAG: anti-sigma factor antagonist [Chrysiogenales bacterium]
MMVSRILYLVRRQDDVVNYDEIVLKVRAADVMDMDNSDALWTFLKTMILGGIKKVMVDMEGLDFIDSSGIGVLIESAKLLRQGQGDIALLNVPERIQTIFQTIKLNRFIKIFASEEDGLSFFRLV